MTHTPGHAAKAIGGLADAARPSAMLYGASRIIVSAPAMGYYPHQASATEPIPHHALQQAKILCNFKG